MAGLGRIDDDDGPRGGGGSAPSEFFLPSCPDVERATSLTGDASVVKSEAFSMAEEYSVNSRSALRHVVDYAVERSEYDREYWGNYTKSVVSGVYNLLDGVAILPLGGAPAMGEYWDRVMKEIHGVVSCVTPRHPRRGPACALLAGGGVKSARERLDELRNEALRRFRVYDAEILVWWKKVSEYKRNARDAYYNAKAFYEATYAVITAIPLWQSIPGMGSLFDVSSSSFLAVDVSFPTSVPSFDDLPSIESIWTHVEPLFDTFIRRLEDIFDTIELQDVQIKANIQNMIDDIPRVLPDDYNPPVYHEGGSMTDEKKRHEQRSKEFLQRAAVTLDTLSSLSSTVTTDLPEPPVLNTTNSTPHRSNITLSFEDLTPPKLDIKLWFLQFTSLSQLLFFIDFAIRGYQSLKILFKFGSVGTLRLPEIDLRVYKEERNWCRMSSPRILLSIVTSPITGLALVAVVLSYGVSLASSLYSPFYQNYMQGCVAPSSSTNGSFVTANLFSMAYNHAGRVGNARLVEGLEEFDRLRVETCAMYQSDSQQRHNENIMILNALQYSFNKTKQDVDLLRACLDTEAINEILNRECCGRQGYDECATGELAGSNCPLNELSEIPVPLPSPAETLHSETCRTPTRTTDLQNAIFNCDELPSCPLTCPGPHRPKLQTVTRDCGCMSEYFLHSSWLRTAVALLIFACLNASRAGIIEGLTRIRWRHLHPELFTVRSTCRTDGTFVDPTTNSAVGFWHHGGSGMVGASRDGNDDEEEEEEEEMSTLLKTRLANDIIPRFECTGYAILIVALLFNLPWIYGLLVVDYSIAPSVSSI
eukprot:CAMPEP_0172506782 /NCGR_PEP_ID=MMETSP1066-20121228/198223_1 /TAXON_ID=671091 /ORGANISM="Coscinodiscus wailesii, Strain CCMP2513" /LENGTH=816 /DNA_ID=CAMNT_0013283975 /DNA_START=430 /DNA_END=2880 /DNA_ORIENTATION=+